jgi:hypothetical protein
MYEKEINDCKELVKNLAKNANPSFFKSLEKTKLFSPERIKSPTDWYITWGMIFDIIIKEDDLNNNT